MTSRLSEPARLREVHKYYQRPPDNETRSTQSNVGSTPVTIPDTALTAFLQLITWRLSKQRAIVSLVDKDHQFFIAESTKTGNLVDPTSYEEPGDDLWVGCTGSTTRGEALCTNTIVAKDVLGSYPSFVVTDLPNDPRFADLPYVKGPPFFRFYAGTPLITKAGFRIGSLFVIDDRVQASLTHDELDFLGVMATNVMRYLELETESKLQRRHMKMSKGLAALVEGRAGISSVPAHHDLSKIGTSLIHAADTDARTPQASKSTVMPEPEINDRSPVPEEGSTVYKDIFERASNLLRESLDADYSLFVDTSKDHGINTSAEKDNVAVVGYSNKGHSKTDSRKFPSRCDLERGFLKRLCQRYRDGKIWTYHEDGSFDHYANPSPPLTDGKTSLSADDVRPEAPKSESDVLLECFPNARQILFAPLWDSAVGFSSPEYFSACFAISNREVPVYTIEVEVAFVRGFVNSVGVMCGHLAAALGEKQKELFIQSMSHELRSPLHGILPSTELLYGTSLSEVQTDLCDTIDVCGQTLLDTLSQILDYSKVDNFLRDSHNSTEPERTIPGSKVLTTNASTNGIHAGSSLHVYSECNIAELCEEALDVVSMSFRQTSAHGSPSVTHLTGFGGLIASPKSKDKAIVVDFTAPNADWMFLCSPGAVRRIVMNLVGNSFKYTDNGSISVRLSLQDEAQHTSKYSTITISVTDTGRGMSDDFMRKKLFVPFSQENTITPGSGLGLSLVQGIVKSLHGKIDVWSNVGRGTKMEVSLPLNRASGQIEHPNGRLKPFLASWMVDQTYTFFPHQTAMYQRLQESIRFYMRSWWRMTEVDATHSADFIFVDQKDLTDLLEKQSQKLSSYAIVLSQIASLPDVRSIQTSAVDRLEPLQVPFGPKKLLKALQACIEPSLGLNKPPIGLENVPAQPRTAKAKKREIPRSSQLPGLRHRLDPEQRHDMTPLGNARLVVRRHSPHQKHELVQQPESGPAVLCVDDNTIDLKLLNTFAKKLGFEKIESAENGLQAFQAAGECARGFDVIFMDLTMPVMDGFESTRRIRGLEAQRKRDGEKIVSSIIVALTGLASEEDQNKAFASGVDHFVTKPLRFKDLKQMLGEWNLHGSTKANEKENMAS